MALIKFTRNYRDDSTDRGFQFEFYCDRCGSGYQSTFRGSSTNTLNDALDVASGLFGGLFGNAADASHRMHSAAWEKQHDAEFQKAIEDVKPYFKQCKRCAKWVDDTCWNPQRGLCLDCAPDLEAEYSAAQTEAAVQQARQVAQEATYVTKDKFDKTVVGACPNCGASIAPNAKFCGECGQPIKREKFCTECGAKIEGSPKFCPECGAKQG